MRTIPHPKIDIYLPLFTWANRHHPPPKITGWQIDRNLRVLRVEVRT